MAFLIMERLRRPVATHGNGFRMSAPFSASSHLPAVPTVATAGLHKGPILRCLLWLRRPAEPDEGDTSGCLVRHGRRAPVAGAMAVT